MEKKGKSRSIPIVRIKGSPLERGRMQGEAAKSSITGMVEKYKSYPFDSKKNGWAEALLEAGNYLLPAESAFPDYVTELRGLAEGANVPFDEVWLLNCFEEVVENINLSSCTCIAVSGDHTVDGHVLLGHNEDWVSWDRDHVYIVNAEPDDAPAYLAITYGALLTNVGFNEAGIGVAVNSVFHKDRKPGVPRIVYSRAILSSRTIGEAIRSSLYAQRAGGYNFMLADSNGELYCIETSAESHAILYGDEGWLAHTNHYLSSKMQELEEPGMYIGSHVRLNRVRRLVKRNLGKTGVEHLQNMLKDHVNYPNSVCFHENLNHPLHEREQTLISLVIDLNESVVWIARGPPCREEYTVYRLCSNPK